METIRIIVVDRHELVAIGVASRLLAHSDVEVVGHATTGMELMTLLRRTKADLVLIDVSLREMDGIDTARQLRHTYSGLKVLAHSALTEI